MCVLFLRETEVSSVIILVLQFLIYIYFKGIYRYVHVFKYV